MFIASADAHLATCSLFRAGAPRTVCRRFCSDFRVARSSEPLAASSMTACTTRANSSCRHRPRVPSASVHAALFAGLPELHRPVGAVNQRRAAAVKVDPRACGGTQVKRRRRPGVVGLSPRVRGNHVWVLWPFVPLGSIPARAGEPQHATKSNCAHGVYPRACGGTESESLYGRPILGLSPRVRGNLKRGSGAQARLGSIPARAGEPR